VGSSSGWCGFFLRETSGRFFLSYYFADLLGFLCLVLFFPFILFSQSFSQDHVDFFSSTETEKKLTSEISALKTDLDLYRSEMEIEHQTHQWEEKVLCAQVIEVEEWRKTAVQEALKRWRP
jgi:hypothetical protein